MKEKQTHTELVESILAVLSSEYQKNGRFFKRQVLRLKKGKRFIQAGTPGQADIWGFVTFGVHRAFHIEIEVKLPGDRLSEQQEKWKKICEEMRVIYILGKTPAQVLDEIRWSLLFL